MLRREFVRSMSALPLAGIAPITGLLPSSTGFPVQCSSPTIDIGVPVFSPGLPGGSERDVLYLGQAVAGTIKEVVGNGIAGQCRRWVVFFRAAIDTRSGVGALSQSSWKAGQIIHVAGQTPRHNGIPQIRLIRAYGIECEPSARTMAAMAALDNAEWGYRCHEGSSRGGGFFCVEVDS